MFYKLQEYLKVMNDAKLKLAISYASLFFSVLFFYLELVHEYFFRFYPVSVNSSLIMPSIKLISYSLFIYFVLLCFFIVFLSKKSLMISKRYRLTVYFLIPYWINIVVWLSSDNVINGSMKLSVIFSATFITSYIIQFVFLVTLIAYLVDYLLRLIIFRNKSELVHLF